jgi:hypothetical protein
MAKARTAKGGIVMNFKALVAAVAIAMSGPVSASTIIDYAGWTEADAPDG